MGGDTLRPHTYPVTLVELEPTSFSICWNYRLLIMMVASYELGLMHSFRKLKLENLEN